MIIVLKPGADQSVIDHVSERVRSYGLTPHVSTGEFLTIIGVIGDEELLREAPLDAIAGVEKVMPVMKPFKLASIDFHPMPTVVTVGGVKVGGGSFTVIAGPCSVENREMMFEGARLCREAGAQMLRGGAFKPRTSPYSFQGLGREGLVMLREAADEVGMPFVTEVMDPRDVELVCRYADALQIGARNMQNYSLLNEVGKTGKPVLLKRGFSASVDEFLMSAEYVLKGGNGEVILCERGIKTFEPSVRFSLDISAVPAIRARTHLPVLVDPSHAAGRWEYVASISRAAVAAGADGLLVEVHPDPENAKSDAHQQLRPDKFRLMMDHLRRLDSVMRELRAEMAASGKTNRGFL